MYQDWVTGPPLTVYRLYGTNEEDAYEEPEEITRDTIKHYDSVDAADRGDAFIVGWERLSKKWNIRFSHLGLGAEYPDLHATTVTQWDDLWHYSERLVPPAVRVLAPGLGYDAAPNTAALVFSLDQRNDVLLSIADKLLTQAKQKRSTQNDRDRKRLDKLDLQLVIFDRYMNGEALTRIAKTLHIAVTTAKSRLAVVQRLTKTSKIPHGKAWISNHIRTCPICESLGRLNYMHCPVAKQRMQALAEAKEHQFREYQRTTPTPVQVNSEKSAFAEYEAKHRHE